jgi:hypothetical protein
MKKVVDDVVADVAMLRLVETTNLGRVECRDTQISCIVARSLAEPPEACRPK